MRLAGHNLSDAGPDQHDAGRDGDQAVGRHGLDRALGRPELVGNVLVEDARPLEEVLRGADEGIDVTAGVDAGGVVGAHRGLEHQLLVGNAGADRGESDLARRHDSHSVHGSAS